MSLVSDQRTGVAHRLTPLIEVEKKKRHTVGWICKSCGQTWAGEQLPPLGERLDGCPG